MLKIQLNWKMLLKSGNVIINYVKVVKLLIGIIIIIVIINE